MRVQIYDIDDWVFYRRYVEHIVLVVNELRRTSGRIKRPQPEFKSTGSDLESTIILLTLLIVRPKYFQCHINVYTYVRTWCVTIFIAFFFSSVLRTHIYLFWISCIWSLLVFKSFFFIIIISYYIFFVYIGNFKSNLNTWSSIVECKSSWQRVTFFRYF